MLAGALLLTGCVSDDPNANRAPGDKITVTEARVLADVLYRNGQKGGAQVSVSAQYAETALLTMTGAVDFSAGTGTMDALTTFTDGQDEENRTIYFTPDRIILGNLPGFPAAMAAAGRADVQYLRTDLDPQSRLVDNIVGMILRLSAEQPDDPNNLLAAGYTWDGTGRIDNILTETFSTGSGTVSVGVEDHLLYQFVAPPAGGDFPVQITLGKHGPEQVDFPPEAQIADASAYPDVASQFGF